MYAVLPQKHVCALWASPSDRRFYSLGKKTWFSRWCGSSGKVAGILTVLELVVVGKVSDSHSVQLQPSAGEMAR